MDGIYVDHAALSSLVEDMTVHVGRMEERLDQLMADLAPLATGFQGRAKQAHAAAQQRWNAHFAELRAVLAQASAAVSTAHEGYRAADAYGAGLFDAIS